ncbi:DNA-directed RNA polymerase III subunit rpc9 [Cytospora mali]|uniref:DNA-directed RNA polymerase III subunit RPC9 n=1 Tax=Cytospora mali TaxID=578113 RepID=A0A194V3Y7_CYTMA|nr:DNA-directed RNA polymerase III subunit rpc9 [Valsa mali var. pyri (nom. inval.)]
MKILESQNAVLTNFEVYQHLLSEQAKYQKNYERKKQTPKNLQTVIREIIEHFRTSPDPLSQRPITYDSSTIGRLVERLRDYDLTKGEVIMILNVRPENIAILNCLVEDAESRFNEDQQNEMIAIIEEVLGPFPVKEAQDA